MRTPSLLLPLCVAGLLMATASPASAKAWKGVNPGKTTRAEVEKKFGKPSTVMDGGGKCVTNVVYSGEGKMPGAKQAQFCVDAAGTIVEVRVFPDVKLDADTVKEAFGEEYRKKLTDDFLTYWFYEREGMVVFFDKETKGVSSVLYVAGNPKAAPVNRKKAPAGAPAAPAEETTEEE